MPITTINPYTRKVLAEYPAETLEEVKAKIAKLKSTQEEWRLHLDRRLDLLRQVKQRLEANLQELSSLMTKEMGKPITQGEAEVKKCLWVIDYIVENARQFLTPEQVKTEAKKSYVRFDPLGVILLVMPWNFPAWQVFRAAGTSHRGRQHRAPQTCFPSIRDKSQAGGDIRMRPFQINPNER